MQQTHQSPLPIPLRETEAPKPSVRHLSRREVWLEGAALAAVPESHNETADAGEQLPKAALLPTQSRAGSHADAPRQPRPRTGRAHITLRARDEDILRAVAQLHFLTTVQICRLFYRPGSLSYLRATLKRLTMTGFLLRLRLPRATAGNAPWVYTLARRGLNAMRDAGVVDTSRFRPAEQREKSYLFLTHTLAVNDFLIAALLLPRHVPQVALAGWQHERDLRRTPIRLTTAPGEIQTVIPDAWLDVHLYQRVRMSLLLELDRGTVEEQAFKRKLRGLLALAAGPYATTFGTTSLTVVFATTAGERRAQQIARWCEQVLHALHLEAQASLVLIGSLPSGAVGSREVFLAPCWAQPFAETPVPLLDLTAAAQMS